MVSAVAHSKGQKELCGHGQGNHASSRMLNHLEQQQIAKCVIMTGSASEPLTHPRLLSQTPGHMGCQLKFRIEVLALWDLVDCPHMFSVNVYATSPEQNQAIGALAAVGR